MLLNKYLDEINFSYGTGKFFTNTNKNYEDILKVIGKDIVNIDIKRLDGLCDEYHSLLEKYKDKLDMSDKRIEKLVNGLQERIRRLENHMEKFKSSN